MLTHPNPLCAVRYGVVAAWPGLARASLPLARSRLFRVRPSVRPELRLHDTSRQADAINGRADKVQ